MASSPPRVSVVLPVGPRFRDRFLDEAVTSILGQEYGDLELVLVDDASGRGDQVAAQARRDPRVVVVTHEENLGDAAGTNHGVAIARGDLIARMDDDDVAEPERIGSLVAALDADPDLGLVGSAVSIMDEAGTVHGVRPMPQSDLEIRWTSLFHNPFFHPTVAYRRALFDRVGGYRTTRGASEDAHLWHAMLAQTRARNLPEPLTRYRINSRGLTAANAGDPRRHTHVLREEEWRRLGLTYDLYAEHPALEISALLRDEGIERVGARMPAYRTVLVALRAFLADSERRAPEAERAQRHRLATGLMAAMVAEPPVRPDRRRRLHELCVSLHPSAARAAGTERLLDAAYAPAPRATPRAEWAPWFDGKDLTDDRLSPHLPRWYAVLGPSRDEPLEILELGSGEGRTAVFLLHFFHHARLTCLEPSARLRANVAEFGDRVGFDVDEEARFDLVVVGADRPLEPGWSRLGPGGVLVLDAHDPTLDDDRTPRPEVEAFLARHAGEYRELARGHQVFVERLSPR